jgi:hypothetical protein
VQDHILMHYRIGLMDAYDSDDARPRSPLFELLLECILTPSRDLAYMEGAAPINTICVQLLHQIMSPQLPAAFSSIHTSTT